MSDRNSPEFAKFKSAIFGQESGNGADKASEVPNYAGALGKGQILEDTFKGLQKTGRVPKDYQWSNPAHNEFAAVEYMAEAWEATGGQPHLAAAYYYAGPKGVKEGQIVTYKDKKNPNAPDTHAYAQSILNRMGGKAPVPRIPSPQDVPLRPAVPRSDAALAEALKARTEAVENRPGFLVKLGAGIEGNVDSRIVQGLLGQVQDDFEIDAVKGYKPPDEFLVGITSERQAERNEARSDRELRHILSKQSEEDFRVKTMSANGFWSGMAFAAAGEVTSFSSILAPMAAARLMALGTASKALQSARATGEAATALKGQVVVQTMKENLYGGTAVEVAAQLAEERFDPANLALSAVADTVFGGLDSMSRLRTARLQKTYEDAALREAATFEQAANNVGPQAKPEQVEAEYQRLRHEEIRRPIEAAIAPVSQRSKLMDHPDEVEEGAVDDLFKASDEGAAAGTRVRATVGDTPTTVNDQKVGADEPPLAPGMARLYHGSALPGRYDDVAWFSTDRKYAANYRGAGSELQYVDVPYEMIAKQVDPDAYGQSLGKGWSISIELDSSVTGLRRPLVTKPTFKQEGNVLVSEFPNDQGGKGYIELSEADGRLFPSMVDNGLPPGQRSGRVVKAYEDAIEFAQTQGKQFTSDDSVTLEAARVYEALSKRGYPVEKNPSARLATKPEALTDRWVTDDGAPVYTVGAKGKSLQGPAPEPLLVRKAIEQALESPALKVVNETSRATRHLLTYLQKSLPTHVLDKVQVKFEGNVRGAYNPIDNDISTPGASADTLSPEGYGNRNDANVLAHEVVHAATGRLIAAVRDNVPGVTAGSKAAVKRLEEIRLELDAHLRAKGIRQPKRGAGADYAAGDLDEFVAQVMSDPETRRVLAKLPAKGFKDLLSAFADAVIRLLGLDPKTNNSALKEAVALVDKIIREGEIVKGANSGNYIKTKPGLQAPAPTAAQSVTAFSTDPIAIKYGLTGLPVATTAERAKAKAILNLYKKADDWAIKYPKDAAWDKRAQNLIDNSVFSAASTGLIMLKSQNPVARMIASELLEDASGVTGRKNSTAAISKAMFERGFIHNSTNEIQNAYAVWRKAKGGTVWEDTIGGKYWKMFNDEVAAETANRLWGRALTQDPSVKAAADSAERVYTRTAKAQIDNQTLGWAALPTSSVGYMPHKISPGQWRQLSNEKRQVVHDALVEQFVNIEGWDLSFSDKLASSYLQRVQARANGQYDAPIGGSSSGSAEVIEDALLSMGMSADEVRKNMQRFNRGAAGWTKGRLDLDLTRVYDVNGEQFRLLEVFETDQLALIRSQAGRASGEVALARKGVYGRPGLEIIAEAMGYGENAGMRATDEVQGAFKQVAAEFMSAPFGDVTPKFVERAMILNSAVRLGGIVFNQFAEFANAIADLGAGRTLSAMGAMPRLRQEIKDKRAGKVVKNGLLDTVELLGGAEFGMDAYRLVLPFDNQSMQYPVYGVDTVTAADRLLRGASYVQGKLSMWRAVHSVQQRGIAEQVVAKIARYSRDGLEDKALLGFGISPEARKAIIDDGVARWDSAGSLLEFDVTKFKDQDMAEDVLQAVHRGTNQIIQGTFIGETGKWAHNGYLKLLTQFRGYSLTAAEKQWGRQRNSHGTWKTLGIMLGTMSVVLPVYTARVYAASLGREDADEYFEERMRPEMVARQLLNYIGVSNLAGDYLDVFAAMAPDEYGVRMTGGRAGTDTDFVGNLVAPSLSLVDDVWKAFQNLDEPSKLINVLPMNNLFYLSPAINSLEKFED